MVHGTPHLKVIVVPDSGSDNPVGLTGQMTIDVVDGIQLYALEYTVG